MAGPRYDRPSERCTLLDANPLETTRRLGWEARVKFRELVRLMVDADLDAARPPARGEGVRLVAERGPVWVGRP